MDNKAYSSQSYTGDLESLFGFFQMSIGLSSRDGVRQLIAIERTRGTHYYTATQDGATIGMIGVYYDAAGTVTELEPPQIIDIAVLPEHRRKGVASALRVMGDCGCTPTATART
jgi:GNAT superfamily N-acetyltransferase